jgi:hypothetical protein
MPKVIIPIYFDYASTLCYAAWRIVRDLEAELEFLPLWKGVPIRLRDGRARPGNPLGAIERMKVITALAETGVMIQPLERWIDSTPALEGAELAQEAGVLPHYHDRPRMRPRQRVFPCRSGIRPDGAANREQT